MMMRCELFGGVVEKRESRCGKEGKQEWKGE